MNTPTIDGLSNEARAAKDAHERRTTRTLLQLKVGAPESLAGVTSESRALQGFCARVAKTITDVGATHFRILADQTIGGAAQLVRSATHAKQRISASREEFKRLIAGTEPELTRLQRKLTDQLAPSSHAGRAMIDAEMRAVFRQEIDPAKAMAMARTDPAMLAALACAPALASGLAPLSHAALRKEYLHSVLPDETAAHEDMRAAVEAANKALSALEEEANQLIDFDTAAKLEATRFKESA